MGVLVRLLESKTNVPKTPDIRMVPSLQLVPQPMVSNHHLVSQHQSSKLSLSMLLLSSRLAPMVFNRMTLLRRLKLL